MPGERYGDSLSGPGWNKQPSEADTLPLRYRRSQLKYVTSYKTPKPNCSNISHLHCFGMHACKCAFSMSSTSICNNVWSNRTFTRVDDRCENISKRIIIIGGIAVIGVGAGNFWGCEKFFPEFLQTCPKNFRATLCANISSHTDHEHLFLSSKKRSTCDSAHVGRQFFKIE